MYLGLTDKIFFFPISIVVCRCSSVILEEPGLRIADEFDKHNI